MSKPEPPAYPARNWRGTLLAALVGLLIALAMAMKWLVRISGRSGRGTPLARSHCTRGADALLRARIASRRRGMPGGSRGQAGLRAL